MKNIEITKKTFQSIFNRSNETRTKTFETHRKYFFFNKEKEQRGLIIKNFNSSMAQYYIFDINS